MVALPQVFETKDLPDTGGNMPLIPPGQYQAVIVESEMKATKNGAGQMLVLKQVITQGQYANTEFIERLNIINNNQVAVEIAYKTLARISEALGMAKTPQDSMELHNKPLIIQIETEAGTPWKDDKGVERQGKDKSIIAKYLPVPAGGAVTQIQAMSANATAPATSPFQAPAQGAAADTATNAAPANPFG